MLDFLIALFGGLYYIGAVRSDKRSSKSYNAESDRHYEVYKRYDQNNKLVDEFVNNVQSCINDIKNDIEYVFQRSDWMDSAGEFRGEHSLHSYFYDRIYTVWELIFALWIAKMGHIHYHEIRLQHGLKEFPDASVDDVMSMYIRAFKVMDRYLQLSSGNDENIRLYISRTGNEVECVTGSFAHFVKLTGLVPVSSMPDKYVGNGGTG